MQGPFPLPKALKGIVTPTFQVRKQPQSAFPKGWAASSDRSRQGHSLLDPKALVFSSIPWHPEVPETPNTASGRDSLKSHH